MTSLIQTFIDVKKDVFIQKHLPKYYYHEIIDYRLQIYTNVYRLYNSNPIRPPNTWDNAYGIISVTGNLFMEAITIDNVGLMWPPEMGVVIKSINANVAPMINGFPVARITYTKMALPISSAKYSYMTTTILYIFIV